MDKFIAWAGYAIALLSRNAQTVKATASPHFGKFTKIRPECETATPVGIASLKRKTGSNSPSASSTGNLSLACSRPIDDSFFDDIKNIPPYPLFQYDGIL